MRSIFTIVFLASLTSIGGCNPKNTSSVKTLENFAAGTNLRDNTCFGDPNKDFSGLAINVEVEDEKTRVFLGQELTTALTALPQSLIDGLAGLRVKFLVTPNAAALCPVNRSNDIGVACTLGIPDREAAMIGNPELSGYTIVIAADPNARFIKHLTIRTIGYFLSQDIASRYLKVEDGKQTFNPARFADLQVLLAVAFFADVSDSKGLFDLTSFKKYLGPDATKIVAKNFEAIRSGKKRSIFAGIDRNVAGLVDFIGQLTADSFDSYYCTAAPSMDKNLEKFYDKSVISKIRETKNIALFSQLRHSRYVMRDFFGKSYSSFRVIDLYFSDLAEEFAKSKSLNLSDEQSPETSGFALADDGTSQARNRLRDARQALLDYEESLDRQGTWYKPGTWFGATKNYNSENRQAHNIELINLRNRVLRAQQDLELVQGTQSKPTFKGEDSQRNQIETRVEGFREGLAIGRDKLGEDLYHTGASLAGAGGSVAHAFEDGGLGGAAKESVHILESARQHTAHEIATRLNEAEELRKQGKISALGQTTRSINAWVDPLPFVGAARQTAGNAIDVAFDQATGGHISAEEIASRQSKAAIQGITDAAAGVAGEGIGAVALRTTSGVTNVTTRGLVAAGNGLERVALGSSNGFVRTVASTGASSARATASGITYASEGLSKLAHSASHGHASAAGAEVGAVGGGTGLLTRSVIRAGTFVAEKGPGVVVGTGEKVLFEGTFHEAINHTVHGSHSAGHGDGHGGGNGHPEENHGSFGGTDSHGSDVFSGHESTGYGGHESGGNAFGEFE